MSIYQTVTNSIIEELEKIDPNSEYKLPWHTSVGSLYPRNVAKDTPYRGINTVSLLIVAQNKNYDFNLWGTFKQWKELGGRLKKGEKAVRVLFWNIWIWCMATLLDIYNIFKSKSFFYI